MWYNPPTRRFDSSSRYRFCGSHVTDALHRVRGDNDDDVAGGPVEVMHILGDARDRPPAELPQNAVIEILAHEHVGEAVPRSAPPAELRIFEQRASPLHVAVRAPAASVANLVEKQSCIGGREVFGSNENGEERRGRNEPGISE